MSSVLVRCASCDGYGWISDFDEGDQDCDWCQGIGYVYRDELGIDRPIPKAELARLAQDLEALETIRLRELGYQGQAKKPWEQAIRVARGKLLDGKSGE